MRPRFLAAASRLRPRTNQFTLFEAPRELCRLTTRCAQKTLDEIQGMGVKWLRVVVLWRSVAPDSRSPRRSPAGFDEAGQDGYNWGAYDRVIGEAARAG